MNTLVLTVTVLLAFALAATGATEIASAQYLCNVAGNDRKCNLTLEESREIYGPSNIANSDPPYMMNVSLVPFIILSIMGVAAGAVVSVFFIKGRSGRHATVGK